VDQDTVNEAAIRAVEDNGIVFLDEIDKVCARADARGADVSREGVQRDLLPLIEGTTVSTKHGPVKTDHILFIASGAFHIAKPSDLLPELQGRLPIRVELRALTEADFVRILTETDNALTRQYAALMETEEVKVTFTQDGIEALARIAAEVNSSVENIGARRLHTGSLDGSKPLRFVTLGAREPFAGRHFVPIHMIAHVFLRCIAVGRVIPMGGRARRHTRMNRPARLL